MLTSVRRVNPLTPQLPQGGKLDRLHHRNHDHDHDHDNGHAGGGGGCGGGGAPPAIAESSFGAGPQRAPTYADFTAGSPARSYGGGAAQILDLRGPGAGLGPGPGPRGQQPVENGPMYEYQESHATGGHDYEYQEAAGQGDAPHEYQDAPALAFSPTLARNRASSNTDYALPAGEGQAHAAGAGELNIVSDVAYEQTGDTQATAGTRGASLPPATLRRASTGGNSAARRDSDDSYHYHYQLQRPAAGYASRAVQFHPDGGQFDSVLLSARTMHLPWGVRVVGLKKSRTIPTRNILPLFCVSRPAGEAGARLDTAPEYASRAVQFHPHGGQPDLVWLSARTPHGGASCVW